MVCANSVKVFLIADLVGKVYHSFWLIVPEMLTFMKYYLETSQIQKKPPFQCTASHNRGTSILLSQGYCRTIIQGQDSFGTEETGSQITGELQRDRVALDSKCRRRA